MQHFRILLTSLWVSLVPFQFTAVYSQSDLANSSLNRHTLRARWTDKSDAITPSHPLPLAISVSNTLDRSIVIPRSLSCHDLEFYDRHGSLAPHSDRYLHISLSGYVRAEELRQLLPGESAVIRLQNDLPVKSVQGVLVFESVTTQWQLKPGHYSIIFEWHLDGRSLVLPPSRTNGGNSAVTVVEAFPSAECNITLKSSPIILSVR